ncbi:MAG TPA: BlaI/MecI/CopY family transcriptional regulator [Verrucomicrobiae bacterium]|nr:BlaI/MecI/CopY family transcriptional regulator [Verrucomicrobiae bacterium]
MSFESKPRSGATAVSQRISEAEWTIMKALWSLRTATAKQVVEKLEGEVDWKPKTIHTFLARLVQKGAVANERTGREYVFTALASEQECRLSASRSFLARVFDGEIAPFLACFLERKKLTRKEIEELKKILEEKS